MVKILGLPFDSYVDGQINTRQSKLAKTTKDPEDITVFNSNTAWVRLSSGVKIDPSRASELSNKLGITLDKIQGPALARNLVLWGGAVGFNTGSEGVSLAPLRGGVGYGLDNSYGFLSGPEQGLKPMPGITNITCNYKNNGSLKQAQVSLKCHTRSQFEALEAVYLRLGYTMVLEWGNTLYFDNAGKHQRFESYTIPNILFKDEKEVDPQTITEGLQKAKVSTAGNYDGMLAKVANYSWTLGSDLSFDIKLDLISTGDIIDSLKANVGGTTSSNINNNFSVSGSIQNIVAIQVNKQASRFNDFLHQLYEDVYSTALRTAQVSDQTRKLVQDADTVAQDVVNNTAEKISKYLKTPLAAFQTLYTQWVKLREIGQSGQIDPLTGNVLPNSTLKKEDQDLWIRAVTGDIGAVFTSRVPTAAFFRNPDLSDDTNKSAEAYKTSLDKIKTYIDNLQPGSPAFDAIKDLTNVGTERGQEIILNILRTGYLAGEDEQLSVTGGKYISSTSLDNTFDYLLQRVYGGDF